MCAKLDIGIIGGGCSGLVTLKELTNEGHRCIVFERSDCIGGLYRHAYQEGIFVSSHLLTMFGDFIGKEETILEKPRMLTFIEYADYLSDYAEYFHLKQFIKFQTEVKSLSKDYLLNKWKISLHNSEQIYLFDRIAICCGVYGNINMPKFKNENLFQGKIKHLKEIQFYEEFQDKQICIVGSGESASDMILAAAKYGKKSFLSIRNDHGFLVPRYIHGDRFGPADLDTSRVHHSIPRAFGVLHTYMDMINSLIKSYIKTFIYQKGKSSEYDIIRRTGIYMNLKQIKTSNVWTTYGTKNANLVEALVRYKDTCQRKGGIKELKTNSIIFDDNSEEYVDEIICCTGFQNSFSFLEQNDDPNLKRIANEAKISHNLYKHCFHPDLGDEVCWIGFARPALGAIPPLMELQARWFGLLCSKKLKLPNKSDMLKQIDKYVKYLEWQLTPYRVNRLTGLTDYLIYSDDLARTIGCRPNFTKIFFTEPKLWIKLMCGPLLNAHYRLTGPHAKPKQAKHIILKAKWVKQPNVLYFMMLICYAFFWLVFGIESCKPAAWYPL
jgi:cation diffusion facilitator CzcD-associated flavoprotein CzcO